MGFFLFRVMTTVYGQKLVELGEDMLQDCQILANQKIDYYKLWYKNKDGLYVSYCFCTYLWKNVTGIIMKRIRDSYKTVSYDDERMLEEDSELA